MDGNKYHILHKAKVWNSIGRNSFEYYRSVDTFEEALKDTEQAIDLGFECKVIHGKELEWEIETEEVITKTVVEKSRRLKNV